ncbi:hypothetical protein HZS_8050 [Henneguya salminicola]|nr:hypothetical protein HZS_8050 [Henneguya salminicola]
MCMSRRMTLILFGYIYILNLMSFSDELINYYFVGKTLDIRRPVYSQFCISYNLKNFSKEAQSGTLYLNRKPIILKLAEIADTKTLIIYYNGKNSDIKVSRADLCIFNLTSKFNNSKIYWTFKFTSFKKSKEENVSIANIYLQSNNFYDSHT